MAINIKFNYGGSEYTLEYNEAAVRLLDKTFDFSINSIEKAQVSDVPDMFFAALKMHHPEVSKAKSNEMFAVIGDKAGLLAVLVEMYVEAVSAILDEPEEGKAVAWARSEA